MMADNQTATDEVEIEVLYTHGAHSKGVEFDDESEAFELARDLRGFGTDAFDDFDRDPQHALDTAYDTLFEFTVDAELDDVHDAGDLLGDLYDRMQGPRRDEQIGYDGSETRSLGVGDVIVVDGQPFMVDRIGFTDMAARYHVEYDDEDDSDDDPELVTDGGVDEETLDAQGSLLTSHLMSLAPVRSAGRKQGTLDATVTVEGTVDDLPAHLFRVADRFDLNVVHRETARKGRGVETVVEICSDERRDTVLDYCEKYDRDVQVLADSGPELAADGGRDPGEQIARVADRATDRRGSIDEHVDLRVTATLPALDDETVTFTTVVVAVVDDDEYGVDGRYVRLGCEGASDEFIDHTGTECHDLSATFDRHDAVDGVGGSYVSGKDDSGQLVYDELEVESVEIVDEEE